MVDRATATTSTSSYVDEPSADSPEPDPKPKELSESSIHETFGQAMLWFMIAADIALGLLVGLLVRMHTDEDYAAWRKLKKLHELVTELEKQISELVATVEIAKKRCMAGILRAENTQTKRRPLYHQALTIFLLLVVSFAPPSRVGVEHFTDSFGGTREIVKGWTPDARGVFTDDLNRSRCELASRFEKNSSGMSPVAQGTDIIGGLWLLKAVFESSPKPDASPVASKTIWIFSDMMNETKVFPMPTLMEMGPERMLERAKANGLLVPLIRIQNLHLRSVAECLTPQAWSTVRNFWTMNSAAAVAELGSYSAERIRNGDLSGERHDESTLDRVDERFCSVHPLFVRYL